VSLVEDAAAARVMTAARAAAGQELAVLVAVEFSGQRRRLSAAARLARDAAAISTRPISPQTKGRSTFRQRRGPFREWTCVSTRRGGRA